MNIIKLLPDHVANQIAAGEVIQRPASAVKEMLENALDSGATNIKLYVKDAGKTLLQVVDDGCGMSEADSRMSFERHATSKINNSRDLFTIKTMGFRGEAMASIAAISHVDLKSKQIENELGTHITIEGSKVKMQECCSCANGTSIAIKNLFFNVPARRNFLKSDKVETRHIIEQFSRIALSNHNVSMSLYLNDVEHFHLGKSKKRQRIVNVIGYKSNQKLVPIEEETTLVDLSGFIGKPEFCKRTRGEQYLFVNNRFIKSAYLHHAIKKAYEGLIPDNYFPSYFLFMDIDPKLIDINIHPTKTEIKFEDEKAVYAIIRSAIKYSLGKYNIAPTLDFNQETSFDILPEKEKSYKQPQVKVNPNYNPFDKEKLAGAFSWENFIEDKEMVVQQRLDIQWKEEIENKKFLQLFNQFIVFEGENGLNIIHQQRAHQRILFEYFLQIENKVVSQRLAIPFKISFSKSDFNIISQIKQELNQMGFQWDILKEDSIEINATPSNCKEGRLKEIFDLILEQEKNENELILESSERIAKIMAKKMAVAKGKRLNNEEMQQLLNNLFSCKNPNICPFGKPVIMNLDTNYIIKQFKK